MSDALAEAADEPALLPGLLLATFGAIAFSGKAIIVKLAYRYDVDAVTLIMYALLAESRVGPHDRQGRSGS